jgi:hypothetical protein
MQQQCPCLMAQDDTVGKQSKDLAEGGVNHQANGDAAEGTKKSSFPLGKQGGDRAIECAMPKMPFQTSGAQLSRDSKRAGLNPRTVNPMDAAISCTFCNIIG